MKGKKNLLSSTLQKSIAIFACLSAISISLAQEKPVRVQQYWPEGEEIVCVNGQNRYTRALYGSHSLYRLETSDRPVFATYDRTHNKNVRFWINTGATRVPLDSTDYCKATYKGGVRSYILRDHRWGNATITLTAIASIHSETSLWRVQAQGLDSSAKLFYAVAPTKKKRMQREGDLGIEPRESYDADPDTTPVTGATTMDACLILHNGENNMKCVTGKQGQTLFHNEMADVDSLLGGLKFITPDPYLNVLGRNLLAAVDGMWDGETWQHGCIGWRMPLPGWRAAYAGDAVGWGNRAITHFNAYAKSQVTDVPPVYPHPQQDPDNNLARAARKWGTPMYSNGYICRSPGNNHVMNHYDMNLCYIDELLWHFAYDADTAYMRKMWPVIKLSLEWEKRNWDPDGDHLYDAYCCIWASDALWYSGGAVTHSSAYNYRANRQAARIAEILGDKSAAHNYNKEADEILKAMNRTLWMEKEGHWAECKDLMGLKRIHPSAALWTIYTPIDCGATSPLQAWRATEYVERCIPRIPLRFKQPRSEMPAVTEPLYTLSTTNWLPYDWSTNNVAHEEVMNMAMAFFEAGRNQAGYQLMKADVMDGMYLGQSPGNFGQISYYDKARAEAYRDFADNIGVTARTLINGLFGIRPDALYGRCIIQPGFPESWDSAHFESPYLSYTYRKGADGRRIVKVRQHFKKPQTIVLRWSLGEGKYAEAVGNKDSVQTLVVRFSEDQLVRETEIRQTHQEIDLEKAGLMPDKAASTRMKTVEMPYNARVDKVFEQRYLSPRPPYTSLQIPVQGIGQWCQPKRTVALNDSGFRAKILNGQFTTSLGVSFASPKEGNNVFYTSLFDNYPDSLTLPLKGKARRAWLLLAGTTNNMQSRIDNALVTVTYQDGSVDSLRLSNPINWCPIEQDYYLDGLAFTAAKVKPYRVHLGSGSVSRNLSDTLRLNGITGHVKGNSDSAEPNLIPDGAAEILAFKLRPDKRLRSLTLRTLSNEIVVGLMGVTLER
jgi:hypothetical protein